jgi:hypothetical protein
VREPHHGGRRVVDAENLEKGEWGEVAALSYTTIPLPSRSPRHFFQAFQGLNFR